MFEAVQKPYGKGNSGYRKYEFTLLSLVYLEIGKPVLFMTNTLFDNPHEIERVQKDRLQHNRPFPTI